MVVIVESQLRPEQQEKAVAGQLMKRIAMETPNLFNALIELEKGGGGGGGDDDNDNSSSRKPKGENKCTLISEESLSRVEAALEVWQRNASGYCRAFFACCA